MNENVEQLHDRLAVMGAELLGKAVSAIADGTAPRIPQDERQYTYAPMLSRDMSPIDWSRPALDIHNQIRGLVPGLPPPWSWRVPNSRSLPPF